jgi:hypothetical protein
MAKTQAMHTRILDCAARCVRDANEKAMVRSCGGLYLKMAL